MNALERSKKEKCPIHNEELIDSLAKPSLGFASWHKLDIKKAYPHHGLHVDLESIENSIHKGTARGYITKICIKCNSGAKAYLESLKSC